MRGDEMKDCCYAGTFRGKDNEVFNADSLFQKAYYELPLTERYFILLVLFKISPQDNLECKYEIQFKDLQGIFNAEDNNSFMNFRIWVQHLANRSWQLIQNEFKTMIRWFDIVEIKKDSGSIIVRFQSEMFPYALKLAEQIHTNGKFVE